MVYACVNVLVMEAMRHLKTLEAKSTFKQYTSWIYHYKRWAAKMLKEIRDKLPGEERTRHVNEIGHWIHYNKSKDWDNEKVVRRKYIWLQGLRITETRLRAYIKFLRREYKIDDETNAPVKSNTVHMILGRIKACQMAARVEATLYKEKELGIMREISVVRSEVLTLLSHHSLLRRANIREITLPDILLYRLASTSLVNLENQPVVMVIAARNSKTSKDACLQQSYAARHLEAELCAVGETGLWMHFILDQIRQFHGVDLIPPVDTSTRERWYKKHMFFARNDEEQMEIPAASHQRWTRQMWKTNGVLCKRNVHAARAGGAQELAIDGTSRAEIAELGHWAINKMTRAYITAILVSVVMKKAGYSVATQEALAKRVRRMMKVIDVVRHLCRSDGEADTEAVVASLNKIAMPGIGTFSDALTVLNADAVATYSQPGKGVKGLGKREVSKLRVACAFVARGLKPEQWVADLFPDTWKEQMKMTLADMAREDAGQLPPTKTSTKRKKTA
ncbi:unnamed protein product [Closterium sp. NIES-65]|nr:unnamed protein product [Closterium sp. NIES-65]